ncbi:hypothetical protein CR513_53781, partial [Mucuna pruriens]
MLNDHLRSPLIVLFSDLTYSILSRTLLPSSYSLSTMANKEYGDKKRSVCETSMLLVANIIRLSSLRFSSQSFTKNLTPPQEEGAHVPSVGKGDESSVSKFYKSERTQEPERIKRPRSYLMKPQKEDPTTYVSRELNDVDINAENYISHIREKIRDNAKIEY